MMWLFALLSLDLVTDCISEYQDVSSFLGGNYVASITTNRYLSLIR